MNAKAYARWAMALMVANGVVFAVAVVGGVAFMVRENWWGLAASAVAQNGAALLFWRARAVWRAARLTMVWDARRRAARWN